MMAAQEHPLAGCRGIAVGIALSIPFWLAVWALAWWLVR